MLIRLLSLFMSLVLLQVLSSFMPTEKGMFTTHDDITVTCLSSTPSPQEDTHSKEVVIPITVHKYTTEERVCILIDDVCKELDFDNPALIKAIVSCESSFNTKSISKENAQGLMQITPKWFLKEMKQFGVTDLCKDEVGNLKIGISYIKGLIKAYNGDVSMALVAYHDGGSAVQRGIKSTVYSRRVLRAVGGYS